MTSHPTILERRFTTALRKKTRRGFSGFPIAIMAFYGPDDKRATKVAVPIILAEDEEPAVLRRWLSDGADVRSDHGACKEILHFVRTHGAKSVVGTDRIIGCPHEEGIDYPEGDRCPQCPFWANRDRWSGEFES